MLDQYRKDAKQKYNEALSAYVTRYFGRPLEKLNVSIRKLDNNTIKSSFCAFNFLFVFSYFLKELKLK